MCAAVVSKSTQVFIDYKQSQQQFFTKITQTATKTTQAEVQQYNQKLQTAVSSKAGYHFLDDNHDKLTTEFNLLDDILQENLADQMLMTTRLQQLENSLLVRQRRKQRELDKEKKLQQEVAALKKIMQTTNEALEREHLLYLHYAILLLTHASHYHGPDSTQVKMYQGKITQLLNNAPKTTSTWYNQVLTDIGGVATTPLHTSKIKSWLGFINIYRIHIIMCRLSWKQIWQLGRDLQWLDRFDNLFGIHVNVGILDSVAPTSNVLSVGLFASRLMVNVALMLRHTFAPNPKEKGTPAVQRFWRELKKRHWVMVNDVVWTLANALTNYNAYFHIADATAGWLLAGFLLFDALWLGWRLYLDEQTFAAKKAQYQHELKTATATEKPLLLAKLRHLENDRYARNAATLFSMAAAFLLASGFTITMLFAAPTLIPMVCFLVCTIAVAMYMSADKFAAYIKANLVYDQDKKRKAETGKILATPAAKQAALQDFIGTMLKNTFMPLLLVGVYTICWPAALVLTVLYIGYECTKGYFQKAEQAKLLPLNLIEKPIEKNSKLALDENVTLTTKLMAAPAA